MILPCGVGGSSCVDGSGSITYPMFKTGTGLRWVGLPSKKCLEQTRERLKNSMICITNYPFMIIIVHIQFTGVMSIAQNIVFFICTENKSENIMLKFEEINCMLYMMVTLTFVSYVLGVHCFHSQALAEVDAYSIQRYMVRILYISQHISSDIHLDALIKKFKKLFVLFQIPLS